MWVITYQMKQAEATWCRKFQGCQLNSRWIWVLSACTRNWISQNFNMKPIWNPYSSIFNMYPERSYLRICRRHSIRGACIGPKLLSRSFCADWKARRSACRPEPFLFGASGALRISEIFSGQRRFDETASKNHRVIKAQDAWELSQHGYIVHVTKLFMDIGMIGGYCFCPCSYKVKSWRHTTPKTQSRKHAPLMILILSEINQHPSLYPLKHEMHHLARTRAPIAPSSSVPCTKYDEKKRGSARDTRSAMICQRKQP